MEEILVYLSIIHNGDWNKIYQFLMRKGFASGDVMRVINNWQEKEEK